MKKLLLKVLLVPIFFIGFISAASAHSYIGSSTPGDGETVEEPVETIELAFDAGIESATTITVLDEEDNEVAILDEQVDSTTYTAILEEPLYRGSYIVEWTALGADGHRTEGSFTFTVAVDEEKEAPLLENGNDEGDDDEPLEEEESVEEIIEEEEQVTEDLPEATEQDESHSFLWLVLIGVIALVVILLLVIRRK